MNRAFFTAIGLFLLTYGCINYDNSKELNEREMKALRDFVFYNVAYSDKISLEQRELMRETEPTAKVIYDGKKSGKIFFSWNIPQNATDAAELKKNPYVVIPYKTINVQGIGALDTPSSVMWSIRIFHQGIGVPSGTQMSKEEFQRLRKL